MRIDAVVTVGVQGENAVVEFFSVRHAFVQLLKERLGRWRHRGDIALRGGNHCLPSSVVVLEEVILVASIRGGQILKPNLVPGQNLLRPAHQRVMIARNNPRLVKLTFDRRRRLFWPRV